MKKYSTFVDRETQHCQVSVLPKLTCGLSAISVKIQANFFVYAKKKKRENEREILKFIWSGKKNPVWPTEY